MNYHYLSGFVVPSGFILLEDVSVSSLFEYSFSVLISELEKLHSLERWLYIFAVECRVNPVFTYFKKPMLTSWWVENLLKSKHTRRGGRVAMMSWSPYIRVAMVNLEVILCWTKNRGNLGFLSAMMVNDSMYSVPIGNSPGCLIIFPMVIVTDRSRGLITANILRCLTGIFTILSESELPN